MVLHIFFFCFFVIQTGTKQRPRCSCEGVVHLCTSNSPSAPPLPSLFRKCAARVQVKTRAMRGRDAAGAAARCRAGATNCCEPIWTLSQVRPRSHRGPQSESDRPGGRCRTVCLGIRDSCTRCSCFFVFLKKVCEYGAKIPDICTESRSLPAARPTLSAGQNQPLGDTGLWCWRLIGDCDDSLSRPPVPMKFGSTMCNFQPL